MLQRISYNFLLAMFVTNEVWLAYAVKIANADLVVINALGTFIAGTFVSLFIYIKCKVTRPSKQLLLLVPAALFMTYVSSGCVDPWTNGLIATTCSMIQYVFTLESVKVTLQTKDPEKVNLIVAFACLISAYAWSCYAIVVGDVFVFVPNVAAFAAGIC